MAYLRGLHPVPIENMNLDPVNPRLPERLKNAHQNEVLNWMLTDATLTDLMASIVENGFFYGESLIGINDPNKDGDVIIVEGNRRLASIKLLAKPTLAEIKIKSVLSLSEEIIRNNKLPKELPIYIVDNRDEVANYLGFRHVSGVKQWPVIAKARYIYSLFEQTPWTPDIYKQLAKEIGSKSVYVRRLIVGYKLFLLIEHNNFFDLDYLSEENFDLSLINDAATMHKSIIEYIGVNLDKKDALESLKMKEFTDVYSWLYKKDEQGETRIGESRNLSILAKILDTDEARRAFIDDNYSLADAAALTSLADDNIRLHLQNARLSMIEAQKVVHNIKSPNRSDIRLVEEVRNSADTIRREMSSKLVENEIQA